MGKNELIDRKKLIDERFQGGGFPTLENKRRVTKITKIRSKGMQNKSRSRLGHVVGIVADVLRNLDKLNRHSLVYRSFAYKPER